ncbi:hypothetical protein COEREDRAFT_12789, partial [Coemansia reversa NRRL 1564]
ISDEVYLAHPRPPRDLFSAAAELEESPRTLAKTPILASFAAIGGLYMALYGKSHFKKNTYYIEIDVPTPSSTLSDQPSLAPSYEIPSPTITPSASSIVARLLLTRQQNQIHAVANVHESVEAEDNSNVKIDTDSSAIANIDNSTEAEESSSLKTDTDSSPIENVDNNVEAEVAGNVKTDTDGSPIANVLNSAEVGTQCNKQSNGLTRSSDNMPGYMRLRCSRKCLACANKANLKPRTDKTTHQVVSSKGAANKTRGSKSSNRRCSPVCVAPAARIAYLKKPTG